MVIEDELVAAIRADPDSDGPRLVYADWLQSRGDPLGEHIVLAIAAARMEPTDPGLEPTRARLDELGYEKEWYRRFDAKPFLDRGMASTLWLSSKRVNGDLIAKLRGSMIRTLWIGDVLDASQLETIREALGCMALRRLQIGAPAPPGMVASVIAGCPTIEALVLSAGTSVTNDHVRAVAAAKLPRLARLELDGARIDDDAAIVLRSLPALRELSAKETLIGSRGAVALVDGPLRALALSGNPLRHDGVAAAVTSARGLESLEIAATGVTDATMTILANAPNLSTLRRLVLGPCDVTQVGFAALIASRHLSRELVLGLGGKMLGLKSLIIFRDDGDYLARWESVPTGPLAERFRIEVTDYPEPE